MPDATYGSHLWLNEVSSSSNYLVFPLINHNETWYSALQHLFNTVLRDRSCCYC